MANLNDLYAEYVRKQNLQDFHHHNYCEVESRWRDAMQEIRDRVDSAMNAENDDEQ